VAAGLALVACGPAGNGPLTGYIEGEYLRVAAPFAGTLQQLAVRRGDAVRGRRAAVRARARERDAARREAEGDCAAPSAPRTCRRAKRRPVEMVAEQLQQARRAPKLSAANLKRQQKLFAEGFVSSAALDDARSAAKRDEAVWRARGQHDDDQAARAR
jgi:HlyD family secretion protein